MPRRRDALRQILHSIGSSANSFSSHATRGTLLESAAHATGLAGLTSCTAASCTVAWSIRHASTSTAVSSLGSVTNSVGLPDSDRIDNGQQSYVQSLLRELRNASGARDEVRIKRQLYMARTRGWTASSAKETWQRTLRLMDSMSSDIQPQQSELVAETVQVTDGYRLKWLKDPLETIAHILRQTSCRMQVLRRDDKHQNSSFSRFILQGTHAQIQAAKRYITSSGQLTMVEFHDSLDNRPASVSGSNKKEGKALQGDVASRYLRSRSIRPRAILTMGKTDRLPLGEALLRANTSGPVDAAEFQSIVLSLIAPRSVEVTKIAGMASSPQHHNTIISPALVNLLSRATSERGLDTSVVQLAFKYLCRHRRFSSIHQVLRTQVRPSAIVPYTERIDAIAFSCILEACVRNGDSDLFVKTLDIMRQHKLPADRRVWHSFYKLTSRYMPRNVGVVERRIAQLKSVQDSNTTTTILSSIIERNFRQQLDKVPEIRPAETTFVQDFVAAVSVKQGGKQWLNDMCVANMITHLLDRGLFDSAFYLLQQRPSSPKLISRVADHFVQSATQIKPLDGHLVVDIIDKLQRSSQELASCQDVGLRLTERAYEQLLDFARGIRSWNLWRCFWQHAASDGRLTRRMTSWIRLSLHMARRNKRKPDVSAANHAWSSNFGRFALGFAQHDSLNFSADSAVREAQKRRCKHPLAHDAAQAWVKDCELLEQGNWPPSHGQDMEEALRVVFDTRCEIEARAVRMSNVKPRRRHSAVRRVYSQA